MTAESEGRRVVLPTTSTRCTLSVCESPFSSESWPARPSTISQRLSDGSLSASRNTVCTHCRPCCVRDRTRSIRKTTGRRYIRHHERMAFAPRIRYATLPAARARVQALAVFTERYMPFHARKKKNKEQKKKEGLSRTRIQQAAVTSGQGRKHAARLIVSLFLSPQVCATVADIWRHKFKTIHNS